MIPEEFIYPVGTKVLLNGSLAVHPEIENKLGFIAGNQNTSNTAGYLVYIPGWQRGHSGDLHQRDASAITRLVILGANIDDVKHSCYWVDPEVFDVITAKPFTTDQIKSVESILERLTKIKTEL